MQRCNETSQKVFKKGEEGIAYNETHDFFPQSTSIGKLSFCILIFQVMTLYMHIIFLLGDHKTVKIAPTCKMVIQKANCCM